MSIELPNWAVYVIIGVVVAVLAVIGWNTFGPQHGLTAEEQRREEIMIQRSEEAARMKITGQPQVTPGSELEARMQAEQAAQGQ